MGWPVLQRQSFLRFAVVAFVVSVVFVGIVGIATRGGAPYSEAFDDFSPVPGPGRGQAVPGAPDARSAPVEFLSFVVEDVQRFWRRQFERADLEYEPTQVVLFRAAAPTGCGVAAAGMGPFYCPVDRRVYLAVPFFRVLAMEFGAPGDFAQAYVVAHELGHHVQTISGVTEEVQEAAAEDAGSRNELSIRLELQADCLAGVWAYSTYERGLLERGDLDEGLRAAAAVGDDVIQTRTQGRIDPETWTHGSARQRRSWFLTGFLTGDPGACDTFSVPAP